jgi:hypothetical protein
MIQLKEVTSSTIGCGEQGQIWIDDIVKQINDIERKLGLEITKPRMCQ